MEVLRIYGYPENVTNVAAGEIVVMSLVLPLLSLFAIALVQMFLSMNHSTSKWYLRIWGTLLDSNLIFS